MHTNSDPKEPEHLPHLFWLHLKTWGIPAAMILAGVAYDAARGLL